jgi:hypothetical protein
MPDVAQRLILRRFSSADARVSKILLRGVVASMGFMVCTISRVNVFRYEGIGLSTRS